MKKLIIYLFPVILLLNSCATYVEVKVLKPAKYDLGNVKRLAVLDFEFVGNWRFDEKEEAETLTEILKEGLKKAFDIDEEKATPPDPYLAFPGKDVSQKFINKLVENGHYSILERDQLSKILDEQSLSMSGIVDESEASNIGKILGVDAIVIGSGKYSVIDDGGWYEHTVKDDDGKKKKDYTYRINRKIDVWISYKIVSVESGEIVVSKENTASNYDESRLFFPYDDYSEEKNEKLARENVPDWKPIVNSLTNKIIKKSIKQIAPYYKKEEKEIKSGTSPAMKSGLKYAERKLWEDAKESWESVLNKKSSEEKDIVHATYNLGIYYEIHGDLEKAEEYFNQCFKMSGKSEYLDARKRIRKRMKELEELEKQQSRE